MASTNTFPPLGNPLYTTISEDTTIEPVTLDALGYTIEEKVGHVIALKINDWSKKNNKVVFTPAFKIGKHEFAFKIHPYGNPKATMVDNNFAIYLCYNNQNRIDWSIKLNGGISIIYNKTNSSGYADPYIIKKTLSKLGDYINNDLGWAFKLAVSPTECEKLVILFNYQILDIWNNEKEINCDNCNKLIYRPNILPCGHVYCESDICKTITKCIKCVKPNITCICDECSDKKAC